MREMDTESPVIWPAWCYSGEYNQHIVYFLYFILQFIDNNGYTSKKFTLLEFEMKNDKLQSY